ncbi:MAG: hypothetical protein ACRDLF_03865, partial [Solirubrobacteraceae bacterium]
HVRPAGRRLRRPEHHHPCAHGSTVRCTPWPTGARSSAYDVHRHFTLERGRDATQRTVLRPHEAAINAPAS